MGLTHLAFNPSVESICSFNQRFSDVLDAAPAAGLLAADFVILYLCAFSKGDAQLVCDLMWAQNITTVIV